YGVFSSTRYPWPGIELDKKQRDFVPLVPQGREDEFAKAEADRRQEQSRLDNEVQRLKEAVQKAKGEKDDDRKRALEDQLKQAEHRAQELRSRPPLIETAYAVAEAKSRGDAAIQLKGDPNRLGDVVPRHFPAVLGGDVLPDNCEESGRRELAEWLVSPENPLPARVMMNRIWQHHFGRGFVTTPNDFGHQGRRPSHPELLDWLATTFREEGWSIKAMHRRVLLSRTYQQSTMRSKRAVELDPANELLAGTLQRRLDAEEIRDTLLLLGGNLELARPGPHPFPDQGTWGFTQHKPFKAVYDSNHRSVYLMTQRIQRHPFLAIFDGADPSTSTGARMTTTTPIQALYLLNDPFVHEQAQRVAERVLWSGSSTADRVQFAFELIFSRPARPEEIATAADFVQEATVLLKAQGVPTEEVDGAVWRAYVRSLFRLNEFVYLD
ncbi:MAG: DUF1553 domain-containing protein, partial [Planctomycetaceae bacterium]|nr:DUF1553 domain-containing protein [Planctomycetaceae bacterium]